MVVAYDRISSSVGKLGETPYEPMKEEQDETTSGESTTNQQLHVLNETSLISLGRGLMARLDLVQAFLLTFTIVANYVT